MVDAIVSPHSFMQRLKAVAEQRDRAEKLADKIAQLAAGQSPRDLGSALA